MGGKQNSFLFPPFVRMTLLLTDSYTIRGQQEDVGAENRKKLATRPMFSNRFMNIIKNRKLAKNICE
jgi:hypothetical protein